MEVIDYQPKVHLFICTRERQDKACCAGRGAKELVKQLKDWLKAEELYFHIKVSQSSCLGYCQTGIAACLYPHNIWMQQISMEDLPKLKKMLLEYAEKPVK